MKKFILIFLNSLRMRKRRRFSPWEFDKKVNINIEHKYISSRILVGGKGRGRAFYAVKPNSWKISKNILLDKKLLDIYYRKIKKGQFK